MDVGACCLLYLEWRVNLSHFYVDLYGGDALRVAPYQWSFFKKANKDHSSLCVWLFLHVAANAVFDV
jgi:hypothetical protein